MKTIVCYGDSNTWGYRPFKQRQTDPDRMRFPWGVRWTSLLQQKLGNAYRIEEEGLNGRTTMFDDPMAEHRNGLSAIDTCMLTKYPVDMVIIMLGTNDTKEFFNMPPYVIARGAGRLIENIQKGGYGPGGGTPEILLLAPIRLHPGIVDGWLNLEFGKKSLETDAALAENYALIAKDMGVHFMNAGEYITADEGDGVHMNEAGHTLLAEKIYERVQEILG